MKKEYDYTQLVKLNHNEVASKINVETGEVTEVKPRVNNIPSGKQSFGIKEKGWRKSFDYSWEFLETVLTDMELRVVQKLCRMAKMNTNSLEPLSDETTQVEIAETFNLDYRKTKKMFDKLHKLGIYAKFDVVYENMPYTKYWILNPYLSSSETFIMTNKIHNLFKDTEMCKLNTTKKIEVIDTEDIISTHNIYILAQEVKEKIIYKLGYSSDIKKRIRTYVYHNPSIQVLKTFYLEKGREFEKEFHKNNQAIYLNEWYDFNPLDLIEKC